MCCVCALPPPPAAPGLLDDAYALSIVRQLNITVFLDLTTALGARGAAEYSPWSVALGWLQRMQVGAWGGGGGVWSRGEGGAARVGLWVLCMHLGVTNFGGGAVGLHHAPALTPVV